MKNNMLISSILISIAIIISSVIIGLSIHISSAEYISSIENNNSRYTMIANENTIIIFDTKTGEYWKRFTDLKNPAYDWTKFNGPEFNK